MAKDYVNDFLRQYEVIGGYFSPVGDGYGKKGLALGTDRVKMIELATAGSSWLTVDPWEPNLIEYTKTAYVMDHFEEELNKDSPCETKRIRSSRSRS
jgi:nicotinamide mononucleotide adenylyltransferase